MSEEKPVPSKQDHAPDRRFTMPNVIRLVQTHPVDILEELLSRLLDAIESLERAADATWYDVVGDRCDPWELDSHELMAAQRKIRDAHKTTCETIQDACRAVYRAAKGSSRWTEYGRPGEAGPLETRLREAVGWIYWATGSFEWRRYGKQQDRERWIQKVNALYFVHERLMHGAVRELDESIIRNRIKCGRLLYGLLGVLGKAMTRLCTAEHESLARHEKHRAGDPVQFELSIAEDTQRHWVHGKAVVAAIAEVSDPLNTLATYAFLSSDRRDVWEWDWLSFLYFLLDISTSCGPDCGPMIPEDILHLFAAISALDSTDGIARLETGSYALEDIIADSEYSTDHTPANTDGGPPELASTTATEQHESGASGEEDATCAAPNNTGCPVVMGKPREPVFVLGKRKGPLTIGRWTALKKLVDAYPNGVDKDTLEKGCGGARGALTKLQEDKDFEKVIHLPGGKGKGGYRLVWPEGHVH